MAGSAANDEELTRALVDVLGDSKWVAVRLAKALLAVHRGEPLKQVVRESYLQGYASQRKLGQLLAQAETQGFASLLEPRLKTGSAENPITKLFPAVITEERFKERLDDLVIQARGKGRGLTYTDNRADHSFIDFTLREAQQGLPFNIKNAGTLFRNAANLVGLEPDDCIPIPAYKAYGALEAGQPNLLYAICADWDLVGLVRDLVPAILTSDELIVWELLQKNVGKHVKDAEDRFVQGIVRRHWVTISKQIPSKPFRLISARRGLMILKAQPKRTPGLGLPAWGTGASAEVNVHVSISKETTLWDEVANQIIERGLGSVISEIDRKTTKIVDDPSI
jgi:hypothetical protein